MSDVAAAAGFSLTVPRDWFEVALQPATRDAAISSLVYERTRQVPELREMRSDVVRLVREFASRAWDSGAVYCACFVQPTAEGPVTGSATVTLIGPPPGAGDGPAVDLLLASLSSASPQSTTVTVTTLPHVGEVARTYGVEDVLLPEGGVIRSVLMQTFIPLGADQIALVTCSSPVLWLEESLLDLFDAVTSTFRVIRDID